MRTNNKNFSSRPAMLEYVRNQISKLRAAFILILFFSEALIFGWAFFHINDTSVHATLTWISLILILPFVILYWYSYKRLMSVLKPMIKVQDRMEQLAESSQMQLKEAALPDQQEPHPLTGSYRRLLDRIQQREQERAEFLGQMMHEVRTPLAIILVYMGLLEYKDLREDEQFLQNCLATIQKGGKEISQILEDAVSIAAIEVAGYEIHRDPIPLNSLIGDLVEEARKKTQRQIIYDNQAGQVKLAVDPFRIREAIQQILQNALQYSPPSQPVEVRFIPASQPGAIEISISDKGIGIHEADLERIFRKFSRIKSDATKEIPGSGLGLYLAKTIVELHGGQISVRSTPGQGSVFTITLPVTGK